MELAKTSSRWGRALFEPSVWVTDFAERRRVRLLAMLQLAQIVQYLVKAIVLRMTETGSLGARAPFVFGAAAVGISIAYALVRTRHARIGFWFYVAVNVAVHWGTLVLIGRAMPPSVWMAFIVPTILIASIGASARGTFLVGLAALGSAVFIAKAVGPPSWDAPVRHGCFFVLTNLVLIIVLSVHRDRLEADRSAELRARNEELEALQRTLEQKVVERTVELGARNAEMRLVLDNIAQGLFTVDRSGAFSSEPSATFTRWFGPATRGDSFIACLGRHVPRFAETAEFAWSQVVDDVLPLEVSIAQLPTALVTKGRQYRLAFEPISAGEDARFLVVVSDVTAEAERESLLRERRETFAIFEHMLADRAQFVAFHDEASTLVSRILSRSNEDKSFARDLHTLKGNALMFGLGSVGEICHDLESRMAEEHCPPDALDLGALAERWARLTSDVNRLLGERKHTIEISPAEYDVLVQAVREGKSPDHLLRVLRALRLEPVAARLKHFAEQARQIAKRLGKPITVAVSDDGLRVEGGRWAPLWAALVHAVRNGVDHGLEPPAERAAAGKPECGHLSLRAGSSESAVWIEVEDDGRGIDWDAVRRRGEALGANVSTDEDLVAALFAGGLSTAMEVTDLSGRGVGMGALHAAVLDLGGVLQVQSRRCAGTLLRMSFPGSSATLGEPERHRRTSASARVECERKPSTS